MNQELKQEFVNHYADYLCSKISQNTYKTIIQVTHCDYFVIINGETTSTESYKTYDTEFLQEFGEKYFDTVPEGLKLFNLIKSTKEPQGISKLTINTPSYEELIKDTNNFVTSSQFPHGHSLNTGRDIYYYLKYISNNIYDYMGIKDLSLTFFKDQDEDDRLNVICDGFIPHKIHSIILDYFDYDEFVETIKEYDILNDFSEGSEKPYLLRDVTPKIEVF
jgi:hypothetical protein